MNKYFFLLLFSFMIFAPQQSLANKLAWPVSGEAPWYTMTDTFGPRLLSGEYDFHRGIDLPGNISDPVYAAANGTVYGVYAEGDSDSPYDGNTIVLRHDFDPPLSFHGDSVTRYYTVYLHLNSFSDGLAEGNIVSAGQQIATLGDSAASFPHLHFEVRMQTLCSAYSDCNTTGYDPHVHPLLFLPYTQNRTSTAMVKADGDNVIVTIQQPQSQLDWNTISVGGKMLNLNTRKNIDISSRQAIDTDTYNNITISPEDPDDTGSIQTTILFSNILKKKTLNWSAKDIQGNTISAGTVSPYSARIEKQNKRLILFHKGERMDSARLKGTRPYKNHKVLVTDVHDDGRTDIIVLSKRTKRVRIELFTVRPKKQTLRRRGTLVVRRTRARLSTASVTQKSIRFQTKKRAQRRIRITNRYQLRRTR